MTRVVINQIVIDLLKKLEFINIILYHFLFKVTSWLE